MTCLCRYYVATHLNFQLGYNDGHVVSANISVIDRLETLPEEPDVNATLRFRYSVSWFSDSTPVQARLYKYGKSVYVEE